MKIIIGLALLSVAFATEPLVLPEAPQPAYEVKESSQADDSQVQVADFVMFQIPDINPAFIDPAVTSMLNEFGEIRQEILNALLDDTPASAVLFVDHADEVAPFNEAVNAVNLEAQDSDVDPVRFVDAPFEDLKSAEVIDPVLFVDAPLEEDAKSRNVVDTVKDETAAVVDPVILVDAPLEEDIKSANVVDSVLVADAPLEDNANLADVPASSALDKFIAKLLADRQNSFSRDNPMLR